MSETGWRAIETAPKSGPNILLCGRGHPDDYQCMVTVGFWGIQDLGPDDPGKEQWCDWAAGYVDGEGWVRVDPAYWMPLPAPPQ